LIGGSGYLAAFVAGLLYQTTAKTKHVAHFYESFNSYLVIPVIFVLLGAIVPIDSLLETTWIGIAAALIFMLIIRPLVVFSSLIPWLFGKNRSLKFSDYVFLSVMRETGGMSAVLLLIVSAQDVPGMEYIFGIGFWVIFLTLLIEPPLIPWVTKKFKIATPIHEHK
jgi:NhaP-type Na+/H+ or K+/H+ antiporter